VEAAANDRLKRGEAANQYSSFDDAPGGGGATTMPNVGRDDGQVVHNPLFDVDAFIEKATTAPASESWHAVPAPAVELAPQSGGGDAECQLSRGAAAVASTMRVTTNAIAVGCTVHISGMQAPGFNGKYGTVVAVQGERWAVAMHEEGGTSGEYGHLPAQANVVALKSNCITAV
jgi:hypothetical protein